MFSIRIDKSNRVVHSFKFNNKIGWLTSTFTDLVINMLIMFLQILQCLGHIFSRNKVLEEHLYPDLGNSIASCYIGGIGPVFYSKSRNHAEESVEEPHDIKCHSLQDSNVNTDGH
ncbi:ORF1014 [White spot syndrome virus]|uniref:Wsv287 n=3 Tax=White spot syndrome virus TaxID=342409 RepID=Q8VAU6_WSSVS|nr:wsv287 [Shrimp white spot syndrome virus]AFX59663.1 wsv287 [White spot syndrome virus]AAL33536.1 wsv287 [Shrimp white spot syndrome virus]AAL89210.1 WSSV342 [Shrimp white spot syndrome virus]ATU83585.1 ORF1014 [White spot syndrome virus]AWQ60417.1 wsv287 [Shrimp white spot syndrome virus]